MADFLSEEWFAAVLEAAGDLPSVDGLSFAFDIEVPESSIGKARGHGQVTDGRIVAFEPGKAPAPTDISFVAKAKRALPIVHGDQNPLVAYMLGELKIDGAYELIIDTLALNGDRESLEEFRSRVAAATD